MAKQSGGGWGRPGEERTRTGGEELYEALNVTRIIVRRLQNLEMKMLAIGSIQSADHKNLLKLKLETLNFCNKICHMAFPMYEATQSKIGGLMETGGESPGRSGSESLDIRELLRDAAAIEAQERIVGKLIGDRMETGGESPGRSGSESLDSKELLRDAAAIETQERIVGKLIGDRMETGGESPGRSDSESLDSKELLRDAAAIEAQERIVSKLIGDRMETGEESPGRSGSGSLDSKELLHDAAAIETQERIVGKSDDELLKESIDRLFSGILKFEHEAGNIASVFEDEKARKEAEAVLSFGFKVDLIGQQIDELRGEMRGIVRSFSPESKDVMSTLIMFTREPYLHRIAKLQWISKSISMLQRMDLDFDSKVKSKMTELKSESFLSALKEVERNGGKGVAADEKRFAVYRLCWERTWGNGYSFEDQSLLSPMQFTHCTPGRIPVGAVAGSTLQIYSIKVSGKELDWPLEVYGVVAARDSADRHRNPLFFRTRNHCQILTQMDPFLQLTGPVRAIVLMDTVYIETQLKKKGATESEDIALVSTFKSYNAKSFSSCADDNCSCTVQLCLEKLEESVQATILSVLVETTKPGSLPFPYGGKIVCYPLPCNVNEDSSGIPSSQVLLFDLVDGELGGARDELDLLRRVVSVELKGKLKFQIKAYSQSGSGEIDAHVLFTPKKSSISTDACYLDDGTKVEITLAWSLLPSSKMLS